LSLDKLPQTPTSPSHAIQMAFLSHNLP